MRRRRMAPLVLLCLPLLAGCSSSGADIELLEQPVTSQDALSAGREPKGFEPDTARFAARSDGLSFHVARPIDDVDAEYTPTRPGVCLIVAEKDFTACGAMPIEAMSSDFGSAQLVSDGLDASKLTSTGWEQVHKNVFVKGLHDAQ